MRTRSLAPVALASAVICVLVLTGCSTGALPGAATVADRMWTGKSCPSAADVSKLVGIPKLNLTADPHPKIMVCDYLPPTTDGLLLEIEPAQGRTVAWVRSRLAVTAPTTTVSAPISGLGAPAISLKTRDGTEAVYIMPGSEEVTIVGDPQNLAGFEKLAAMLASS